MRATLLLAAALIVPMSVAGCGPGATKQDQGLVVGAVAGGIIGHAAGRGAGRVVGTALGVAIGGIVGSEIGRSMDQQDRILAQQAEIMALERGRSGVVTPWRNPDNGRRGEVIPGEAYMRGPETCRPYEHRVFIDGRPQIMRGEACRNPDGTWRNVS